MESRRAVPILILLLTSTIIHAKVYGRCELTRELLKMNFSRTFLSNWVCLIEKESEKNTAAINTRLNKKYYGLFQIGNEWCKEGKKGGKCNIPCEALIDEDIKDDAICALKIFELEGFKYWTRWESRCKGQDLPDVEKCAAWEYPPSRYSVSPSRDKRYSIMLTRWRRSLNRDRQGYKVPNGRERGL